MDLTRQTYNRLSRWYDILSGGEERKLMELGLQYLNPIPGEKVLEIGCGTGNGLLILADAVSPSGSIFGLDISEGMLSKSNKKIQQQSDKIISLQQGDALQLPYDSEVFTAIFLSFTLELFDDLVIPVILSGCKRVLKPDGRIGIVTLQKRPGLSVSIYEWFHKVFPTVIDCHPIILEPFLKTVRFNIISSTSRKMWGLPVEVIIAEKNREAEERNV